MISPGSMMFHEIWLRKFADFRNNARINHSVFHGSAEAPFRKCWLAGWWFCSPMNEKSVKWARSRTWNKPSISTVGVVVHEKWTTKCQESHTGSYDFQDLLWSLPVQRVTYRKKNTIWISNTHISMIWNKNNYKHMSNIWNRNIRSSYEDS
jgi:hypothetical protein